MDKGQNMLKKLEFQQFDLIYKIMKNSFPVDEHRPYEEQKALLEKPEYQIYILNEETTEKICGFLAIWEFDSIVFIEHFAVVPEYRNGGIGAKMSPSALLVINNGQTKLVNIKQQDAITKILDLVPDVIDKFTAASTKEKSSEEEEIEE